MKEALRKNKKAALLGLILLTLLSVIPQPAHAILGVDPISIAGTIFKLLSYVIMVVFGLFFELAAGLVDIAMALNSQILSSSNSVVEIGWTVARDIANLGFVLIMVVMSIATIVRYETYAVKKLLPLLIGAAIIVNFSLTIAGIFVKFSDTLTNSFTSVLNFKNMSDALTGAFSPQRLLLNSSGDNPLPPDPASQGGIVSSFSTAVLVSIAGLIFNIVFIAIATFSMAALALLLFYRYIALSLLLVLAPIAWLFYVFPDLKSQYAKWWNEFIKWIFFMPAATFFMFLAVVTADQLGKTQMFALSIFSSTGIGNILAQGGQMIVLAGLMWGGLYVSNKMGVEGAAGAIKLAQKGKDATLSFAGRKALQYGSSVVRGKWFKSKEEGGQPQSAAERLVDRANNIKNPFGRAIVGTLARGVTRVATVGGEGVLKEHEARVSKMSTADAKAALTTAAGPFRIALIKRLSKDKQLGSLDMRNISDESTKALFARFNQGREFGDIEKNGLMTVDMAKAIKSGDQEALAKATDKLVGSMTRKDLETASIKDLFSGKKKFGLETNSVKNLSEHFARALESENPGLVPSMIPKFDSSSRKNFTDTYRKELDISLKMATQGSSEYDEISKMKKQFETVLANYTVGLSPVEETVSSGGGGDTIGGTPTGGGGKPKP